MLVRQPRVSASSYGTGEGRMNSGNGNLPQVPGADQPCPVCEGPGNARRRGPHAANGRGEIPEPKFWTVAEAARMMRVSNVTVYRLVRSGALDSVRAGRAIRIPEQTVKDYLTSIEVPSPKAPSDAAGNVSPT